MRTSPTVPPPNGRRKVEDIRPRPALPVPRPPRREDPAPFFSRLCAALLIFAFLVAPVVRAEGDVLSAPAGEPDSAETAPEESAPPAETAADAAPIEAEEAEEEEIPAPAASSSEPVPPVPSSSEPAAPAPEEDDASPETESPAESEPAPPGPAAEDEPAEQLPVSETVAEESPEPEEEAPVGEAEIAARLRAEMEAEYSAKLKEELARRLAEEKAKLAEPRETVKEVIREVENFQSLQGFPDGHCTLLSSEELYCTREPGGKSRSGSGTPGKAWAAADGEGDKEIFIRRNGQDLQITSNNKEDRAPVWDETGQMVVWQSLLAEHWEINFSDLRGGKVGEIPSEASNNIHPHAQGGRAVWQGWMDGNWEIFFAERNRSGEWAVRRLTQNSWPDTFPKVMGNSVLWQSFAEGSWHVYLHDLSSGETSRLSRGTGKNENPRIAVLWDSTEGGVRETMHYDLSTGDLRTIGGKAAPGGEEPASAPPAPDASALPSAPAPSGTAKNSSGDDDQDPNEPLL